MVFTAPPDMNAARLAHDVPSADPADAVEKYLLTSAIIYPYTGHVAAMRSFNTDMTAACDVASITSCKRLHRADRSLIHHPYCYQQFL